MNLPSLLVGSALLGALLAVPFAADAEAPVEVAANVSVTILSSNLANGKTIGEWGLSALVELDGRCILFDAGRYPDTVIRNARVLGIDLSCATDVVLSHFHFDHTTGLLPLIAELRPRNPAAMRTFHVAQGFFASRRMPASSGDAEANQMIALRGELEAAGVTIIEYAEPTRIGPAVWVTGPVERTNPERNYSPALRIKVDGEWVEDPVPDSQALAVLTAQGPIVLLGCGHAGAVNTLEQVQRAIQPHSIHALMGGMHLFAADDETLKWTAAKLRDIGVQNLMAGHCTGIEPLIRLRAGLDLDRRTAVVGAVGSRFVYGEGIHPTAIAQ